MHHWRDGWSFHRRADGAVIIGYEPDPGALRRAIQQSGGPVRIESAPIAPAEWASIVAAVPESGDNGYTHEEAYSLHMNLIPELDDEEGEQTDREITQEAMEGAPPQERP